MDRAFLFVESAALALVGQRMSTFPEGIRSSNAPLDLRGASRDLWPGGTLDAWQGRSAPRPSRVFWPRTPEEVLTVLRAASEQGISLVPFGAGSGVSGGARAIEGSWTLDTKALDTLGDVDRERWSVTVGAGVNGEQLEDHLAAQGFTMGHSPSSISCSTVGGWAAARSAGQFSSKYGVFEDMVLQVQAVAPGPGVFTVGQDGSAPAAWMDQVLGSEGTLAVVTRVTLRVWPLPETRWLRGYRFASVGAALAAMRTVIQGELHPSVVRLYDPVDTLIGGKTRPKERAGSTGSADGWLRRALRRVDALGPLRARSLALPLALPGLVNTVAGGAAGASLVILGFEGDPAVVRETSEVAHALMCARGEDLGAAPGERWYASRHAVSYKLMPVFERGGFVDTMEVAARWSRVEAVYDAVRAALKHSVFIMAHMSHVYPEGACIYFSFAGVGDRAVYDRTWELALAAVAQSGGTVSHHHGIGTLKAAAAAREVGHGRAGWSECKAELDPMGVLNPGRLFASIDPLDPGAPPPLHPDDGLVRSRVTAPVTERLAEARWPFARLPGPARWHRSPWQTPWIEVAGRAGGGRCLLGRGPRSAVGPDLRAWLAGQDAEATATWAADAQSARWMGEAGALDAPWQVALALLRSDLRPAVITVVAGRLRVGFRGPAAAALGALASDRVPGGLQPVPYEATVLPAGPLRWCPPDGPGVVAVTPQGTLAETA